MRKNNKFITISALLAMALVIFAACNSTLSPTADQETNTAAYAEQQDDPVDLDEISEQENNEKEEYTFDMDARLLGVWETVSGVPLWYFCSPTIVEFFPDGRVHETCCDKYATLDFHNDGRFTLIGRSGHADTGGIVEGPFIFTYSFSDEQLTIIDQDGDLAVYSKK
jgi:hypothetical protein